MLAAGTAFEATLQAPACALACYCLCAHMPKCMYEDVVGTQLDLLLLSFCDKYTAVVVPIEVLVS